MLVLNKSNFGEAGSSREARRSAISSLSHQFFQLRGLTLTTAHYHTSRHTSCMESLHECLAVATVKDKVDRCSACDCTLLGTVRFSCFLLLLLLPYVYRDRKDCQGQGARSSTSTFTQLLSSEILQFSIALRPQRPYGLSGTGSPGRPSPLSHSS